MTEILGIGSAILDQIIAVPEEYLDRLSGEKWGSEPVDHMELAAIIQNSGQEPRRITGGSAANAVKGLASLGNNCGFIAKIGQDAEAEKIISDFESTGIAHYFSRSTKPTAQVACLVTPDGKRTMRHFMGASGDLSERDLKPAFFEGVKLVHLEAYTLYNENLTQKSMEMAKSSGALLSFDLSSFELVETHRQTLLDLIERYVDILFANADEASALTHLSPEHGCMEMAGLCGTAVVMNGAEGCFAGHKGKVAQYPAFPVKPVDTTGAGDLFASGFLHGWLQGEPIETCARYGALLGKEVVQVVGAEIPREKWEKCQIPCK